MKATDDQINGLLREVAKAANKLSEASGASIECSEVLDALVDVLKLESQIDLLDNDRNAAAIVEQSY